MLTKDDGTSHEYLELMSPYATNRHAVGRYYDMIIMLMLFVMFYCIYRTGEVQLHVSGPNGIQTISMQPVTLSQL